jgi:hypothetical protein
MTNHPITLLSKLVAQWRNQAPEGMGSQAREILIAARAAKWGAAQELEACCEWFQEFYKNESWMNYDLKQFRAARRPKPPSLKEQALDELVAAERLYPADWSTIRRALEALPND